tara:strand:- start:292 stop:543 length:252 start_codon:yes stop_codon:yes gene_type:complete
MIIKGTVKNYKEIIKDVNWKKKLLAVDNEKNYYIYYTEFNGKKLIKPYCKYKNYKFQRLFGFSQECKDYTPERIIDITEAVKL